MILKILELENIWRPDKDSKFGLVHISIDHGDTVIRRVDGEGILIFTDEEWNQVVRFVNGERGKPDANTDS